jgi:hypothetical protein
MAGCTISTAAIWASTAIYLRSFVLGFQLAVNFDPQVITLFKEVRNLSWLNFQVPHAVSLMETVRAYGQTLDLVESNKGIEWLVGEYRNEAQLMVSSVAFIAQFVQISDVGGC